MTILKKKRNEKAAKQIKRLMEEQGVEFHSKTLRRKLTKIVIKLPERS